jgi:outer membrane protein assembly factor BamB
VHGGREVCIGWRRLLAVGSRIPGLSLVSALCALVTSVLVTMSAITSTALSSGAASGRLVAQPVGEDWPTYLHDAARSAASDEALLSPSNVSQLKLLWAIHTAGPIAASAAVVAGTVYVGSWDGYEYALNADTGAIKWRTYLGQTDARSGCSPPRAGVTSSATVQNGVVYVGGGDAYWYALDASTGAVLWRVYTGDNGASSGHYNWSSPLIFGGDAYIGIASYSDCPTVQGRLLQVSLASHQVVNALDIVPSGHSGGGLWTSPALDAATNTLFLSTGNGNPAYPLAQAVIAVDATRLAVRSSWVLPASQAVTDSDWGTTPLLYTDAGGTPWVAAANKNGTLYAFHRASVGAGPVWQRPLAIGGECPECGQGVVSSGTQGRGHIYVAGGHTTLGGSTVNGSVRALDPANGAVLWQHATAGPVIGALAYVNGLVFDGSGNEIEALDASTGARLFTYTVAGQLYAPPAVSNGVVFEGSMSGTIYALSLDGVAPRTATASSLASSAATPTIRPTATQTPISAALGSGSQDAPQTSEQAGTPLWLRAIQLLLVLGIVVCSVLLWREQKQIRALGRRVRVASRSLARRITARPVVHPPPIFGPPTATRGAMPRTSARVGALRRMQRGEPTGEPRATTGRTLAQPPGTAGWRQTSQTPRVGGAQPRGGQSLWDWANEHGTDSMRTPTRGRQRSVQPDDQSPTGLRRVSPPPPDADWMR